MTLRILKSALIVALMAFAMQAMAQQTLADAKANGLVGERVDGLVGIVAASPTPAIQQMVDSVNAERLREYREVAAETNAPLEAVQQRAGRQLIQRLNPGEYFTDAAGRWRQK